MKKKQSKSSRMDESLGMRRGKESSKKQSYKSRRDESMGAKKAVKKKPAKSSEGDDNYTLALEKYNRRMGDKSNHPAQAPADISGAFKRAKMGYSNKPKVKMNRIKGK